MHPICLEIGGKAVHWYGVMVSLAFLAAIIHWSLRADRDGFPKGFGLEMGFWMMVCGITGGRIAYVIAHGSYFRANLSAVLRFDQGGMIFYGGLIGACFAVIILCRTRKQSVWAAGDVAVSGLPLGHAIGRLGCFLNGCCFGKPTGLPWGVHYPDHTNAAIKSAGAAVHPVQLYEFALNILLYVVILSVYGRRKRSGEIIVLYLLTYPVGRFMMEFIRGDERAMVGSLTVAQGVSVALFLFGVLLYLTLPNRRMPHDG
ncbi:MAG: prolipoprotein diacylglyceryl transferase [Verrucomicrobia bacterium]|nr:prolipoprotein diacylglyceryl transferase [Verrucomicrobiota bacterium]